MSEKTKEVSDEEYYGEIARKFRSTNNPRAIESYGKNTEPAEGKGTKTRVLRTKDLRKIQFKFLSELEKDVLKNAVYSWRYGSVLPGENSPIQPLGDYPETP